MKKTILFFLFLFLGSLHANAETLELDLFSDGTYTDISGRNVPTTSVGVSYGSGYAICGSGNTGCANFGGSNNIVSATGFTFPENYRYEQKFTAGGGGSQNGYSLRSPGFSILNIGNVVYLYYNYVLKSSHTIPTSSIVGVTAVLTVTGTSYSFVVSYGGDYTYTGTFTPITPTPGIYFGKNWSDSAWDYAGVMNYARVYDLDGSPIECSIIQQSSPIYTSIINTGSIEDITGTGADITYKIGTGSYVRFFNISNLVGVDDLFYSSGSMTLKSSNAIFGEKPSIYIGSLGGLDSIDISSDLGLVNIYGYNQGGDLIFDLQKQILASTVFFPSKATYIILEFGKSFFTYTVNSIDIRSKNIGTVEKELCLNTDTQEYTLDGEPYTQTSTGLDTPTAPPSSEWSYTVSGYNFFENGFCLANFVPNPYGGKLRFEIVTPAGDTQTTQDFGPYETDGFGYGFDSCVKVTTFFHENAGIYKVRVLYEYNGETVFPFGSDYNSYTISLPEVRANIGIDNVDNWSACGTDTGTFAGITNFFDCLNKTVSRFFTSVYKNIQKIGDFISHMTNIFTTEVKTFSFIEKSYAFGEDFYVKPAGYDALIFGKITNVFNLVVALCGIILSIGVIVYIKNNKND